MADDYSAMQKADALLSAAVDHMRERYRLAKDRATIVGAIKETMHTQIPPRGLTVFQVLWEQERQGAFNKEAADEFPDVKRQTEVAIRDFSARNGRGTARKAHQLARSAWKEDAAADRRAISRARRIQGQPQGPLGSPFRDRPEVYDPDVVIAFADAIARAATRPKFSWTRRVDNNKSEGEMLDVLVASIQWAMSSVHIAAGSMLSRPVRVTAGGLLSSLRARRPSQRSTD
jgi:hypothetical protein